MKNYAKFCKITLDNKKYQLNLTESGQDDAHFFNKFLSVNFYLAPTYMLYKLVENFYLKYTGLPLDKEFITKVAAAGILFVNFCLPITNVGKGYNAILRTILLKNKTKKFYSKMRKLEFKKDNINTRKIQKKQIKMSNKFLKHLKHVTNFNDLVSRKYQKRIEKKGFVDGTRAFANDNIETVQEGIDKFIFHNRHWLKIYCSKYKEFISERANIHYSNIKNGNSYYDEYVWSATHENDMLVKNDCLFNFEKTNYFEELKVLFNFEIKQKEDEVKPQSFEVKENKIEKVETPVNNIYKIFENAQIKEK